MCPEWEPGSSFPGSLYASGPLGSRRPPPLPAILGWPPLVDALREALPHCLRGFFGYASFSQWWDLLFSTTDLVRVSRTTTWLYSLTLTWQLW